MPTPTGQTICLMPENVLEIAKNTLKPGGLKCEWIISSSRTNSPVACSAVLGSWNAYLKHLLLHAQYQWNKTGKCVCCLTRCNLSLRGVNTSFDHLKDHIENSHMSRVPLYCPFRGCERTAFSRAPQLENHFKETHSDLLNKVITVPSDSVLPISVPYFPLIRDLPPPLPSHPMLGCLFVPVVRGARIHHAEGVSLSQASQASPRKRLKLHQMAEEEERLSDSSSIFFDDFEKQFDKNGDFKGTIGCVIGQKAGPRFDVARPQPILDPMQYGLKSPPISIHYSVFSDRFDEMERAKAPKANMPVVPISTLASSTMH